MAYTNLTTEQAAKLAQALGPEFTASAKNDLLNFADAIIGLKIQTNDKAYKVEKAEVEAEKLKVVEAVKPKAGK